MSLTLENITRVVDGVPFISDANISFEPGSFNVLLGHTLAGKTSLMRLMAGLDKPTQGRVLMDGADVTGMPVQQRNVSMVYQQFINYPNLTVRENIASPLRLSKMPESQIKKRVDETAAMLRIDPFMDRLPLELSGGQQQRTAMARALVKDASLILFDEPLVNLDYKLREELRMELRELFKERRSIAIYATTEPNEALALGGTTTLLHEGRIIQSGPVNTVYRQPVNVTSAALFSEPPINLLGGRVSETEVTFDEYAHFPLNQDLRDLTPGDYSFGVRPSHIGLVPRNDDDLELSMQVELAEISGSETFMHVKNRHFSLVLQLSGVHEYRTDAPIKVYLPTHKLFVFDKQGAMLQAPTRLVRGGYIMAEIHLKSLAHSYSAKPAGPEDYAIREMDHVWHQGGAYALLGPSGCGKSTLLNIISGLLAPSEGEVLFDNVRVNELSPKDRNIAQVFQFPVIYDSMTVFDNLAFPLRNAKVPEPKVRAKVNEVAEILELHPVLHNKAKNLTADEKQKVSMGRGLVRDDVSAILFDEPLTVIDPHLKWKLRRKLKQIHEQFNITMVYVTHDQLEASTFADKIAVMYGGQIVQFGTPRELFESPNHTFVGFFIGSPGMNLIEVRRCEGGVTFNGHKVALSDELNEHLALIPSDNLKIGIRPEFVHIWDGPTDDAFEAEVKHTEDLGTYKIVTFELGGQTLKARMDEDREVPNGRAYVSFPQQWLKLYVDEFLIEEQAR